jgi:hypothetical protein
MLSLNVKASQGSLTALVWLVVALTAGSAVAHCSLGGAASEPHQREPASEAPTPNEAPGKTPKAPEPSPENTWRLGAPSTPPGPTGLGARNPSAGRARDE